MVSLRLSPEEIEYLEQISRQESITKTAVIKAALHLYFEQYQAKQSPYHLGQDLFGRFGSKDGQRSLNYKKQLKRRLNEKHTH